MGEGGRDFCGFDLLRITLDGSGFCECDTENSSNECNQWQTVQITIPHLLLPFFEYVNRYGGLAGTCWY